MVRGGARNAGARAASLVSVLVSGATMLFIGGFLAWAAFSWMQLTPDQLLAPFYELRLAREGQSAQATVLKVQAYGSTRS